MERQSRGMKCSFTEQTTKRQSPSSSWNRILRFGSWLFIVLSWIPSVAGSSSSSTSSSTSRSRSSSDGTVGGNSNPFDSKPFYLPSSSSSSSSTSSSSLKKPSWFSNVRQRLSFHSHHLVDSSSSIDIAHVLASSLQYGILVYLGFEIGSAIRDALNEIQQQQQQQRQQKQQDEEGMVDYVKASGGYISQSVTNLILVRMYNSDDDDEQHHHHQPDDDVRPVTSRGKKPIIFPPNAVSLILQLKASGVPIWKRSSSNRPSIQEILPRLTKAQAQLLQSCLVVPNPQLSLEHTIGGLDVVKKGIAQYLRLENNKNNNKNDNNNPDHDPSSSSPFYRFVHSSKHHPTTSSSGNPNNPLQQRTATTSTIQGVLLYGPPGCGKSLFMATLSNELQLPTLVITPSTLQRKWYGDSNAQVKTLFGLIHNLGHTLVILDELDGLFRERNDQEHEVSRDLKTEFLQWWDGVSSQASSSSSWVPPNTVPSSVEKRLVAKTEEEITEEERKEKERDDATNRISRRVIVIGATNRPFDVDSAVLRRLPQSYLIGYPNVDERRQLLWKWIHDAQLPIQHPSLVEWLVHHTHMYTPSDLYHVLQAACHIGPLGRNLPSPQEDVLTIQDVQMALEQVPATKCNPRYLEQLQQFYHQGRGWQQQQQQQQQQQSPFEGYNPFGGVGGHNSFGSSSSYSVLDSSTGGNNYFQHLTPFVSDMRIGKWETPWGNFYHLGQVVAIDHSWDYLRHHHQHYYPSAEFPLEPSDWEEEQTDEKQDDEEEEEEEEEEHGEGENEDEGEL